MADKAARDAAVAKASEQVRSGSGFTRRASGPAQADPRPYEERMVMTPGRELYEKWLWHQRVPPDDLWDHLDEHDRIAWEALAGSFVTTQAEARRVLTWRTGNHHPIQDEPIVAKLRGLRDGT